MRIAKPIRIVLSGIISSSIVTFAVGLSVAIHEQTGQIATVILALPSFFLTHLIVAFGIDFVDLWLRQISRDPGWVMVNENRKTGGREP